MLLLRIAAAAPASAAKGAPADITQHDVIPILNLRCTVCHGLRRQEAGLDLRTKESMLKGGKSGPAIVPGKPDQSRIIQRIHAGEMPPPKELVDFGVRPVEPAELETLTQWIAAGAPLVDIKPDVATTEPDPLVTDQDRQFWSFQPPQRPPVPDQAALTPHPSPSGRGAGGEGDRAPGKRIRNPIDAFILRKLDDKGLTFSPEADRLTLIRRVAFDLTGLPPTWDEVEAFLADNSPDAYEKMVERYLASPHYGERWGRYWLDLAGYADSEGKRSADVIRPYAWKYRDYVIRSFNDDKPYDRFLLEQIAGDELVDYEDAPVLTREMADDLIATGFLRMAPDGTGADIVNTVAERMEVVSDELRVLGSAVLGLTIQCAQCHSHKYDPIPQRDYYRLVAVFKGAYDVHDWLKSTSVGGQTKGEPQMRTLKIATQNERRQWEGTKRKIEAEIAERKDKLAQLRQRLTEKHLDRRLAKLPEQLRDDLRRMLETPAEQRTDRQRQLAEQYEEKLRIDEKELVKLEPEYKAREAKTDREIKELRESIPPEPAMRALWDRGVPSNTYIYLRGEYTRPGRLVGPGVPSVLTDGRTPFDVQPPWPGSKKTGRRLALAKWLIQPDHPLTARVIVNRIWQHHFGQGIVKTLDNFGKTGSPPSHPELLDWLACEFVDRGWSIKEMHRLMLTSRTYKQVSTVTEPLQERDPENRLLSRMPLGRMQAEVLRDSILAVAGQLNREPFGPPDPVKVRDDGLVTSLGTERGFRRSVYVQQRRKEIPTILDTFDLPQMIPNCVERPVSTVASQALHLMNDGQVREMADRFAERVVEEVGPEPERQVERVYQLALSRLPTDEERKACLDTLAQLTDEWQKHEKEDRATGSSGNEAAKQALATFCHTILNSAAFLYID